VELQVHSHYRRLNMRQGYPRRRDRSLD
jgi:hypothetical protein